MDKKLFEELKDGLQQMHDDAAGAKVKGVREVTYDNANFRVDKKQFDEIVSAIDRPPRNNSALKKLLTEPGVFDEK